MQTNHQNFEKKIVNNSHMMRSFTCNECGNSWSCCADCTNPGECASCKATKVRRLVERLNTLHPLDYEKSREISNKYGRACIRVVEDIVLEQCDKYGMWPYRRYERRDGTFGFIVVYFEPDEI